MTAGSWKASPSRIRRERRGAGALNFLLLYFSLLLYWRELSLLCLKTINMSIYKLIWSIIKKSCMHILLGEFGGGPGLVR